MIEQINFPKQLLDTLSQINYKSIPKVPHQNEIIPAKITRVYDGDTVNAVILHGNTVPMILKLRIMGIDTPEKRSTNENEVKAAKKIQQDVEQLLVNEIYSIKIYQWDKYGGRVDADLFVKNNSITLSECLIAANYAKKYDGGHKEDWTPDDFDKIMNGNLFDTIKALLKIKLD